VSRARPVTTAVTVEGRSPTEEIVVACPGLTTEQAPPTPNGTAVRSMPAPTLRQPCPPGPGRSCGEG